MGAAVSLEDAFPAQSWKQQAQPGGFTVTGGVGGISFSWTELLRGASELENLAVDLRLMVEELERINAQLTLTRSAGFTDVWAARAAVTETGSGVANAQARFSGLAADVRKAFAGYAAAEESVLRRVIDAQGPLRNFELRHRPVFPGTGAEPAIAGGLGAEEVVEADAWYHQGDEAAAWLFGEAADEGLLVPGPVSWTQTDESTVQNYDGTLSSLIDRNDLGQIIDGQPQAGMIEVLKIEDENGVRFAVTIPGTQGASPIAGENPLDPTGIAEAMTADSQYLTAGVLRALRDAGATAGDSVLLNGHSQGGLHAYAIAGNPAFLAGYEPKFVVTTGAPTANMDLPAQTVALSLEQEGDIVPLLDLRSNPDARNRVTVSFSTPVLTPSGAEPKLSDAHGLHNYSRKAEVLESSEHVSIAPVVRGIAAFVPAGATITSYKYRGERQMARPGRAAERRRPVAPS